MKEGSLTPEEEKMLVLRRAFDYMVILFSVLILVLVEFVIKPYIDNSKASYFVREAGEFVRLLPDRYHSVVETTDGSYSVSWRGSVRKGIKVHLHRDGWGYEYLIIDGCGPMKLVKD